MKFLDLKKKYKELGFLILTLDSKFIIVNEKMSTLKFDEKDYKKYEFSELETELIKYKK